MSQLAILLTACVNPNGMAYTTVQNPQIRLNQYKTTLRWYLENTKEKIVFIENTLCDFSNDFYEYITSGRLEYITFEGNTYNRMLGKGYGEAMILNTALEQSKILRESDTIIKITGRLKILNINKLIHNIKSQKTVYANTDIKNGHAFCYSTIFISPKEFLKKYFLPKINSLNDSNGYYFEHLLYDTMMIWRKAGESHSDFKSPLIIDGISGSTGKKYLISKRGLRLKSLIKYLAHKHGIYRNHFYPDSIY